MSSKGLAALALVLLLTAATLVSSWSHSLASVVGVGALRLSSPADALVGTPQGLSLSVVRTLTASCPLPVNVRTGNPVRVYLESGSAPLGVTISAVPASPGIVFDGGGALEGALTAAARSEATLGAHAATVTVRAVGQGFAASVDIWLTLEVVNHPPRVLDAEVSTVLGTAAVVDLARLASDPDGRVVGFGVSGGAKGSLSIVGSHVTYDPDAARWAATGEDTFAFTAQDNDGAIRTGSVKVRVTVPAAPR